MITMWNLFSKSPNKDEKQKKKIEREQFEKKRLGKDRERPLSIF